MPVSLVVMRTPLLPWRTIVNWPSSEPEARAYLAELVARPEVRETLFLGARGLFDQLDVWRDDPRSERGQKLEHTLVRYLARMATRATPYSQFAAVGLGAVASPTRLDVPALSRFRRAAAPSMRFVVGAVTRLEARPDVRRAVAWFPNPTLTAGPNAEFSVAVNDRDQVVHHVQQVELTDALQAVVERARSGALQRELAELLVGDDVTMDEALAFVDEAATAQVLVSELRVPVTGLAPERVVIERLRARGLDADAETLERFCREAEVLSAAPIGSANLAHLDAVTEAGKALVGPALINEPEDVLSIDLVRPSGVQVPAHVFRELERTVAWLETLAPPAPPFLQPMIDAFVERYEEREVPLLEALDPLRGLPSPREAAPAMVSQLPLGGGGERRELPEASPPRWLLDRWLEALREGRREVVFEVPRDFEGTLSVDVALWLRLEAKSAAAVDAGDYRTLFVGGGPLLGAVARFGRSIEGLPEAVAALVAAEEAAHPDDVFAEIVHLPSGFSDNVVTRPAWRRYEIPIVGRASVPPEQQLPLSDLLVSVRDGAFVVRSKRLDKRVRPVAATAFNYEIARESRAFRFLSGLTDVKVRSTVPLGDLSRATWQPRVRVGRVVLSPERWKLDAEQRAPVRDARGKARRDAVAALRRALGWPRYVVSGGEAQDTQLVIDLDNPMLVDSLAHQLSTMREPVIVKELFVGEGSAASDDTGPVLHELVAPCVRATAAQPTPLEPRVEVPRDARTFTPGSAWAYLKCYGAPEVTERWLLERAAPLLRGGLESGALERWFFLHYGDPRLHLRVRLSGPGANALASQLLRDAGQWVERGLSRVEWSTYDREVERYGGPQGIELAEQVFTADSTFALDVLPELPTGDERVLTLIACIDRLFDDLEVDLTGRAALVEGLRAGYAQEFSVRAPQEDALSRVGRALRATVDELLQGKGQLAARLEPALARRSASVRLLGPRFRSLVAEGLLTRPLSSVVASLAHLLATRLLNQAVRRSELLTYDLLTRRYRSLLARRPR